MSQERFDKPSNASSDRFRAAWLERARRPLGFAGRMAAAFLDSKLTPLLVAAALFLGFVAVVATPREEEPQIQVPMVDVFLTLPGASASEVENQLVGPVERVLAEIPEIEHLYATSRPSGALVIARFRVGTSPDRASVAVHTQLARLQGSLPVGSLPPLVVPRGIDDVPVVAYTLWSEELPPAELDRSALELRELFKRHPQVATVHLLGRAAREVTVTLDLERLAARNLTPAEVANRLGAQHVDIPLGTAPQQNREVVFELHSRFASAEELKRALVGVRAGPKGASEPIYLEDVATVRDGPAEPEAYVWMTGGAAAAVRGLRPELDTPALTLAVAKQPGSSAIDLVRDLDQLLAKARGTWLPSQLQVTKTRDYGSTALEKSNELMKHLALATVSVVALMAVALGRREAIVVGVAVPVTLALTLAASYFFGYTLNRVTLFALIFAIGILVDDAIVVVENIHRHYQLGWAPPQQATIYATDEVGNPTILATLTVVAALLPLASVSGLMGPYMRPIPVNASAAMLFSLLVAFVVSPWLTYRLLRNAGTESPRNVSEPEPHRETALEHRFERWFRNLLLPLLTSRIRRWLVFAALFLLLLASIALVPLRLTIVKMLPHDNKSELQVILNLPEGSSLEQTAGVARELAFAARLEPEVTDIQTYVGTSGPFNFNGLVRRYFLRSGGNVADLQIQLVPKHERSRSSHQFARELRSVLEPIARRHRARIQVAEVPPGPPVLSTLVFELYASDRNEQLELARQVEALLLKTPAAVDVDTYIEDPAPQIRLVVDRERAVRAGVLPLELAQNLRILIEGQTVGTLKTPKERDPIPIRLQLPLEDRGLPTRLSRLMLPRPGLPPLPLGELVRFEPSETEPYLYRKDLRPVSYVIGEVAGIAESPVYLLLELAPELRKLRGSGNQPLKVQWAGPPEKPQEATVVFDGEWQITREVFRDMGLAFGVVLLLIYFLVVGWYRSFWTPLLIMAPIPLTLIGILPAHALGGVYFTATSMIGFIALAGIIVRNSILLVDFIELELRGGAVLEDALCRAAAVRFRPIALTAAALVVGGAVILLDPIFQGLAVALISGVLVSTASTLVAIPLLYAAAAQTLGLHRLVVASDGVEIN
jgi:multidrug efflux pump subunit AcrB